MELSPASHLSISWFASVGGSCQVVPQEDYDERGTDLEGWMTSRVSAEKQMYMTQLKRVHQGWVRVQTSAPSAGFHRCSHGS